MMLDRLHILAQYLAPQHALTRLAGKIAESRTYWLKNFLITRFIKHYGVDLRIAKREHPDDYVNFNDFFIRELKPELRPIVNGENELASPVDGCVSQLGDIENGKIFQAKNFHYSLNTLLANSSRAEIFRHGKFATIYLAPKDYHRVHIPLDGALQETIFVPGSLFSVNKNTTQCVPDLFARNERLICFFDTSIGPMAIILIGAMLVGSINTVWSGTVTRENKITSQHYSGIKLSRGEELGYFKLGSSVIVLFPENKIEWKKELTANRDVKMGELLGIKSPAS